MSKGVEEESVDDETGIDAREVCCSELESDSQRRTPWLALLVSKNNTPRCDGPDEYLQIVHAMKMVLTFPEEECVRYYSCHEAESCRMLYHFGMLNTQSHLQRGAV